MFLDGEDVDNVTALRTELPLGRRFLIRRDVFDGARPLPVALEPGTSTTAAFFWDTTSERASDLVRRRIDVPFDDAEHERAPASGSRCGWNSSSAWIPAAPRPAA